ncbi:hypothetical protein O7626_14440 [Micromonospora sp. WMMD1102]|uniref:hypothetical protein n=1 Tax=Micromonospora sp. WMMD1102 TaxID=3016105 RepID=UPI0024157AC0|nr:hypothetical protein [Micromonospora sp. WMMD1102]MDG4787113.1 hypothetical protein [Micromonospora sp. WMMD1102]
MNRAAPTLTRAADLIRTHGHHPAGIGNGGYSIPAAITTAAAGTDNPQQANNSATRYVLTVLGHHPDQYGPHSARRRIHSDAAHLGVDWAVAVCQQAAALATTQEPDTPAATTTGRH